MTFDPAGPRVGALSRMCQNLAILVPFGPHKKTGSTRVLQSPHHCPSFETAVISLSGGSEGTCGWRERRAWDAAGPLVPCRLPPCECLLLPWPLGVSALSLCSSGYSSPRSSARLLRLWVMQHSRCSSPSLCSHPSLTFPGMGALFLTHLPHIALDDQRDSAMDLFTFCFNDVPSPGSFPVWEMASKCGGDEGEEGSSSLKDSSLGPGKNAR